MKNQSMVLLTAALFVSGAAVAGPIDVQVNGTRIQFIGAGPQQVNGRVLVPLRGVLEEMGARVSWLENTQTVIASLGNQDLSLPLNSRTARVNGRLVRLDVPAMTVNGRTMVPLRFIAEALGADVHWNEAEELVSIQTSGDVAVDRDSDRDRRDRIERAHRPDMPRITEFTDNLNNGLLRQGQSLHVTIHGTPGGRAWFRIRGLVGEVPMREVTPGVYRGEWTSNRDRDFVVEDRDILAVLTVGNRSTPEITVNTSSDRYR